MAKVRFTCTPDNLPSNEMVTVSNGGHGELYLKEGNVLYLVTSTNLPAFTIASRDFRLHGHTASSKERDGTITIEHQSSGAKDRAFYTVLKVDIDIDSDNDAQDGTPMRSAMEEDIEDVVGHPGRALALNELDLDKDGVPDYADGFDSGFGPGASSAPDSSAKFIPLVLECGQIPAGAVVKIEYEDNESNPATLPDLAGNTGAGKVRLWRKNGNEARLKATVPVGDFIPSGCEIPAAEIGGKTITYYIEAVGGSASPGDVVFTLGISKGKAKASDSAKATVFHIEAVHPIAADFASGQIGKAMISTKQDDEYYTTNVTTRAGTPAQTNDHKVVATAYVVPIPPNGYNPPTVHFEVTDPDDLSPYEGAPSPGASGDTNPNDNNDPAKAMKWNGGSPSGYDAYQANVLSVRDDHPRKAVIDGIGRYAAETTLKMTDRYAGDNYQIRATLQNPNGNPFDTLSGMTAPFPAGIATSVKASETLIAWKRVYIEQDEMYKKGCTLTAQFSPTTPPSNTAILTVDSTNDFPTLPVDAVVFWKGGSANVTVTGRGASSLEVTGLNQPVPKYGGVRIVGQDDCYTVDRRFLPNAYGSTPDGTDGGAFIEFKDIANPNPKVPKYNCFPPTRDAYDYGSYWFDNISKNSDNTLLLLVAKEYNNGRPYPTFGLTWPAASISFVFHANCRNDIQRNDTSTHEIGHRFGLLNASNHFSHIDRSTNWPAHNNLDKCIMSYDRTRTDTIVEFCRNCLLDGSALGANDSLRTKEDE